MDTISKRVWPEKQVTQTRKSEMTEAPRFYDRRKKNVLKFGSEFRLNEYCPLTSGEGTLLLWERSFEDVLFEEGCEHVPT